MTRNNGTMADPGSVSYLFTRKGVVVVAKDQNGGLTEDDVLGAVLDAGAEEVNDLGEAFEVVSEATDLVAVRTALQEAGIDYDSAEAPSSPRRRSPSTPRRRAKVFRLIDALEDSDDVQNVYANFDVSDEVLAGARARRLRPARLRGPGGARRAQADRVRVLGVDPGLTRCGIGVVDGADRAPGHARRTSASSAPRSRLETGDRLAGCTRPSTRSSPSTARTSSRSSGSSASTTSAASWAPPRPRASPCSSPPGRGAGGPAHPDRGQGRRHRVRPGRQGPGRDHGRAHPRPAGGAEAGGRRRRRSPWRSATCGAVAAAGRGWPRAVGAPRAGRR